MLGEGVHGEMRLREKRHAGHTAQRVPNAGEHMPLHRRDRMEAERVDETSEERTQHLGIGEALGIAPVRLDDPLATTRVHYCWALPHSEQNFAARAMDVPQLLQNFVAPAGAGP